ncbi:MAG: alpha/beta fold hydrolase [Dehalococcoidia bacterium]|nr:alpha/beta fold hydrolase [Dehalococcoidia bacterium]
MVGVSFPILDVGLTTHDHTGMEPRSYFYESQRLRLHYVLWGDESKPPLVLVHGMRDHARNWDQVAERLLDHFSIYAVDLRGHGDSQWAFGSLYSVVDFTADLAALANHINRYPITLIGHSLGGSVALQYAGVFPETVHRIVSVEGLGPPLVPPTPASRRMRVWIDHVRDLERRRPRRYDLDHAVRRMEEENPHLSHEMAAHLTVHGSRPNDDGTLSWKFDNFTRMHSPYEFNIDDAREIWNQIRCPVLLIRGGESWARDPEEDGRASAFHNYDSVCIDDAGHWVHHDQIERFMEHVTPFLLAG